MDRGRDEGKEKQETSGGSDMIKVTKGTKFDARIWIGAPGERGTDCFLVGNI